VRRVLAGEKPGKSNPGSPTKKVETGKNTNSSSKAKTHPTPTKTVDK